MNAEQKKFLDELAGASAGRKKLDQKLEKKNEALEETLETLTDKDKEELRDAMNFYAVDAKGNKTYALDERGQEYALDTEAANRKGQQVGPKMLDAARKQFDKIIKMVEKLRAAKTEDGEPLFDANDIADEIFTPLVREGILPENLVTDQYSEVQKLLGASFKGYKETLEEARQDQEKAKAKTEADYHGAGSKMDQLKALGTKASDLQDRIMDSLTPKAIGTKEERARARDLASASYSAVSSVASSVSDVRSMASGAAVKSAQDMLDGVEAPTPPSTFFSDWGEKAAALFDKNPELAGKFKQYLADAIQQSAEALDQMSDLSAEMQEQEWYKIASSALSALEEAVASGKETVVSALEIKSLKDDMAQAKSAEEVRKSAAAVIGRIDQVIGKAVGKVNAEAGAAIAGAYANSVKASQLVEAAIETEPEGDKIIGSLAAGFGGAFKLCAPDKKDKTFEPVGVKIGAAFKSGAKPAVLAKAIKEDPKTAFDPLVELAEQAMNKSLGLLKDIPPDDPGAANSLKEKLAKPDVRDAMKKNVAAKLTENLAEDLEASEEKMAEYERQLVLMDEAGEDAAGQRSIEKLIAQLKADKKTLDLAVSLGSGLSTLGSAPAEIASKATKAVTEKLVGEIAGPLQAAKLIVQLSVNIINAAERWKLWYKFRANLELSRKAVSALSSTIQGFYDNKKEQIAFHTIEDALIAVQIAGSVLGSIPEPITLAVGKTMNSVAQAASAVNTVAGKIYNEAMLRKAWATTKAAMDNPKDRSLGLAALRLNPTLSMHAIAWAALEKHDPIARVFVDSCGLNEQTLADGGTTEKKIRQYLETLLDEDRKLKDVEQIKTNWQPKNLALSPRDWAIVQGRAAEKATPKLRKDDTSKILEALKKIDANGSLETLKRDADDLLDPAVLDQWGQDVDTAIKLMNAYQPRTEDGSPHEEMAAVLAQFLKLANDHKLALIRAADENRETAVAKAALKQRQAQAQPVAATTGVAQEV
jgi:hypothetical protein